MEAMNILYAKLTNECNLSCPHCNILNDVDYDEEKFFEQVNRFEGEIIAFGGEPTIYRDRLLRLFASKKVMSITTNLLILDDELIEYYKDIGLATSWNENRFLEDQYDRWLMNLKILYEHDISCSVLITMTDQLIHSSPLEFIQMIKLWNDEYYSIENILLEQLIDPTKSQEFYDDVDDWLCEIHRLWNLYDIHIENRIMKDLLHWNKDCNNIYTLEPNGTLRHHCPHPDPRIIREECLTCSYADICRPCILQQHCTFPKKLYTMIKKNEG